MQSKNLGTYDPTTPYHQDWTKNLGGAQDPYGDEDTMNYDDSGYDDGGYPTGDSYTQPANVPLDANTVRDTIDGLLAFAKDQHASRAVISEIEELMGAVDSSATLSPSKQQAMLQNIMNELPSLQSNVVADAAAATAGEQKAKEEDAAEEADAAAAKEDGERADKVRDKIADLTQQIASDPNLYQIEKDDLMAKLERATKTLEEGDVDLAELAVSEVESGLEAGKAEGSASALELIKASETKLRDLQYRLEGLHPSRKDFKDLVEKAVAEISQLLADLKSGAVKPEDAESKIRHLDESIGQWEVLDSMPKVGGISMF